MQQLITLFQQHGFAITYASPASDSDNMLNFDALGINKIRIEPNNPEFDDFISGLMPHIVIFDRFMMEEQFGWRVAQHCPQALRILETVDLHCLRHARQQASREGRDTQPEDLFNQTALREIASIWRCDLSLIISQPEMDLLCSPFAVDEAKLHYIPFMLDKRQIDEAVSTWPGFDRRLHYVSIGNFLHPPNRDAVLQLKQHIWPLIRQALPQAELHIYGAYPSEQIHQLHKPSQGFFIDGWTPDALETISRSRIMLAPLRFGAGLKGKLVDAMMAGTPSITTTIGAEGMSADGCWAGTISDDIEEFARAAATLYQDEAAWNQARQTGPDILKGMFDRQQHGPALIDRINSLGENLAAHRQANFTGAMLTYHTMKSGEYMARWIETKNKLKTDD